MIPGGNSHVTVHGLNPRPWQNPQPEISAQELAQEIDDREREANESPTIAPEDLEMLSSLRKFLGTSPKIENAFNNLIAAIEEEKSIAADVVSVAQSAVALSQSPAETGGQNS